MSNIIVNIRIHTTQSVDCPYKTLTISRIILPNWHLENDYNIEVATLPGFLIPQI